MNGLASPPPCQIDYREWHRLFLTIPPDLVESTRYYQHLPDAAWSQYLFPPSSYAVYGSRLLRKLKFDNSLSALRLWGFALSEGERIYRARQAGMRVVAVMGDLGAVTPLIYSFPNVVAFYPDCLWWTPFLMESRILFDEAGKYGLGEDCCFVRAALGAFSKQAYFPCPDLCLGTVGATCDDMAALMGEVERLGHDIHYFELPHRSDNPVDRERLIGFLAGQYADLCVKLERTLSCRFNPKAFKRTVEKINRLRGGIADLKRLVAGAERNPMGAAEMMNIEFAALSYYGDLDECLTVLEDLRDTVRRRVEYGEGYEGQELRLMWITPPADPLLLNYAEELGGRVVGSEYVINQSKPQINTVGEPFRSLAEAHVEGSLMGTTGFRTQLALREAKACRAEGAIISGVFGSTHCPYETAPIINAFRAEGFPTLAFNVVTPGKIRMQSQIYNRLEAFLEALRARRSSGNAENRLVMASEANQSHETSDL